MSTEPTPTPAADPQVIAAYQQLILNLQAEVAQPNISLRAYHRVSRELADVQAALTALTG